MVTVSEGVVKYIPVPTEVPPVEVVYQSIVPKPVVAESVMLPGPQRVLGVTEVKLGIDFIVATTGVRDVEAQPL